MPEWRNKRVCELCGGRLKSPQEMMRIGGRRYRHRRECQLVLPFAAGSMFYPKQDTGGRRFK